jgi:hypothetical protein
MYGKFAGRRKRKGWNNIFYHVDLLPDHVKDKLVLSLAKVLKSNANPGALACWGRFSSTQRIN